MVYRMTSKGKKETDGKRHIFHYKGKDYSGAELARKLGISPATMSDRARRFINGSSTYEEMVCSGVQMRSRYRALVKGEYIGRKQHMEITGCSQSACTKRFELFKKGELNEEQLMRPPRTKQEKPKLVIPNGNTYDVDELVRITGCSRGHMLTKMSRWRNGKIGLDEIFRHVDEKKSDMGELDNRVRSENLDKCVEPTKYDKIYGTMPLEGNKIY